MSPRSRRCIRHALLCTGLRWSRNVVPAIVLFVACHERMLIRIKGSLRDYTDNAPLFADSFAAEVVHQKPPSLNFFNPFPLLFDTLFR